MRKSCNNKSYAKFEQKILITFALLCKKVKNRRIVVRDLINEANISHATFYKHFKTIEDVYEALVNKIGELYYAIFLSQESISPFSMGEIRKCFNRWFCLIQDNLNLCQSLSYSNQLNKIVMKIYHKTHEKIIGSGINFDIPVYALQAKILSLVAGILNIIASKLRNEISCSWEELTDVCINTLLVGSPNFLKS